MLQQGSVEISVSAICEEAHISRGTFYRYFNSKEDFLASFSKYMRDKFETTIKKNVIPEENPVQKLKVYLECIQIYLNDGNGRRFFEIEPDFSLRDFRNNFQNSIDRTQRILDATFTVWESSMKVRLDRPLLAEMLVRYMLSELIVPSEATHDELLDRFKAMAARIWPHAEPCPEKTQDFP